MTAFDRFDRFEQRVPELMDELAPARVPDYFDNLLQATAGARQRPAWTSLERWLPVQLTASSAWARRPAMRPLALVVLTAALVLALAAAFVIGSRPRLPAPFGLAGNGTIVYSDQSSGSGQIYTLDPVTGNTRILISGSTNDLAPSISPDGRQFLFARLDTAETFFVANINGSNVRELLPGSVGLPSDWSSDGTRILAVPEAGGNPIIVDVSTGARTPIHVSTPATQAYWLPDGRILLVTHINENPMRFSTVAADGTGETRLTTPDAGSEWSLDPATGRLAWMEWNVANGNRGVLHVLTTANGDDRIVASTKGTGAHFFGPQFSPDGQWLAAIRHTAGIPSSQLVLMVADGSGGPLQLGPVEPSDQAEIAPVFAPDGKSLVVRYDDGSVWRFSIPDGAGARTTWPNAGGGLSWQRVAN